MVTVIEIAARFQQFFSLGESWVSDLLPWYRDGHDQRTWIEHTPQQCCRLLSTCGQQSALSGVSEPESATVTQTLNLKGCLKQWRTITPEYEDRTFDTLRRSSAGIFQASFTGSRPDATILLPARSRAIVVSFYVSTRRQIASSKDPHWLLLFFNTHPGNGTGWHGYDLLVNSNVRGRNKSELTRISAEKKEASPVEIWMRVKGNELMSNTTRPTPAARRAAFPGFSMDE